MAKKISKKRSRTRKLILIVVAILVALAIIVLGIGNYMVNYSIGRAGDGGDRQVALDVEGPKTDTERIIEENRIAQEAMNDIFLQQEQEQIVEITSEDGLLLHGGYFAKEENNEHLWAIVIHGYRGQYDHMISFAQRYHAMGYQVVMPDLRACGESEGDFVGMGWPDRKDILCWIDWILEQDEQAEIVIHGVSMGGATTMMTSGMDTPDAVKVFIEDCGYTSVWDIFASELKLRFHLPEFPVMYSASFMAKIRAGYGFKEASALKQVAKCEKPMLFIHGDQDDFVPFYMEEVLYNAKPGDNKELVVATDAGHGEARLVLGEEYWEDVFTFIDKYMAE